MFDFSFSERRQLFALVVGIISALAFLLYGFAFVSYRYTTDYFLGENSSGATFEDPKVSLGRLKDAREVPPTREGDVGGANLDRGVFFFLVNGDRTIRIRSVGGPNDAASIAAFHHYLTDGLSSTLASLANDNRRRAEIKIQEAKGLLAAVAHDQQMAPNNLAEVNRSEAGLEKLKIDLREELLSSQKAAVSSENASSSTELTLSRALSQLAGSYLLSSYQTMELVNLPAARLNIEQNISRLQRVANTAEADLELAQLDLARWRAPSISVPVRDVGPTGPGPISRFVFGFIAGLVVYVTWFWLLDRWKARRPQRLQ